VSVENHDLSVAVVLNDVFEEVEPKSGQSVFIGNHKFLDLSFDSCVQNGSKSFPLEVKTASNVGNELVSRISFSEELNLSLEIVFLILGGDPTVTDSSLS